MASMATMATLSAKCSNPSQLPSPSWIPPAALLKPPSLLSLNHQRSKPVQLPLSLSPSASASNAAAMAIAGSIFAALGSADASFAAQQVADLAAEAEAAGGDNRVLALLIPIVPAILWVLYNILQPALNQINRMRSEKAVAVGLGIGGALAAAGFVPTPRASAEELMVIGDAAASSSDSRGLLLLFVVAPAIAWVLFNILQPALNQINRMRSG